MENKRLRFFISAGEASGDLHGADLVKELLRQSPDAGVTFLGGDMMAEAAGLPPLIHYRDMAYMGFAEVLRHLPAIARNLRTAREAIERERPDALVLIDYPSFNLKLARFAKSLGIPVFYFIAPKVWAWKEWRVKEMRRYCDKILSILPFEQDYFRRKGLEVEYVGNPSVAEVEEKRAAMPSHAEFNLRYGLDPNRPLLALVPGSRPEFPLASARDSWRTFGAARVLPQPGRPVHRPYTFRRGCHLPPDGPQHCRAGDFRSGHRSSGSKLFYKLMSHVLTCPHISLPNLIANGLDGERYANEVVPELLMHQCNPAEISARLARILPGEPGRQEMLEGYRRMRSRLTDSSAPRRAAAAILSSVNPSGTPRGAAARR